MVEAVFRTLREMKFSGSQCPTQDRRNFESLHITWKIWSHAALDPNSCKMLI
jgi:hypothetical protein